MSQSGRFLLQIIRWPLRLLGMLLLAIWHGVGWLGLRLCRGLSWFGRRSWAFLGRTGLALRRLLTRFIWQPLRYITSPLRRLYFRFLHAPLSWLFRHLALLAGLFLIIPARWVLSRLVIRPVRHLFLALKDRLSARWRAGEKARYLRMRHWRSQWAVRRAWLWVAWHQPRPPRLAIVTPTAPRPVYQRPRTRRLATTAATAGLLMVVSFFTVRQVPQLGRAMAEETYTLNPSKFLPTATPLPPLPTPTRIPPTPWPTPDPLDGGGSVAFTLRRNGNSDLYVLSIGQSQPVRLTNHPAEDRDPAWSPDGQELAFASHRDGNWELYILTMKNGAIRRLTNGFAFDGGPAWSPDGEWLVYESYQDNNLDLYIINKDGSTGPIRLTENPAPDFSPVWSPGGRHIAFTSWRSGNKDLFILSLDAASDDSAVNITNSPDAFEDDPAFSPAGDKLAYHDDSTGFELVYALPLEDYRPAGLPVSYGQGRHPTWSPDGAALAYIHGIGQDSGGQSHLIAGSLDAWSVAPQAFTTNGRLDNPAWSARTLPRELPAHLKQINEAIEPPLFVEGVEPVSDSGPPYLVLQMPVNAPAPYLNDRVDQSFLALRDHVLNATGWDFLGEMDNMFEVLDTQPLPEQSNETWNKAGRAFDYYSRHVLSFEPQVEIVRENRGSELYWRTYLLAGQQDGTQGEPLRDLPWDFRARYGAEPQYYDKGGKWRETIPAGYYVDFTALAADYGWSRVPAGEQWRTYFPAILFWHYENRQGMTWDEAMLELFTPEQLVENFGH